VLLVALLPLAASGWLYLLTKVGPLGLGPSLRGSLPLEQLAGQDAQPLGRIVAAWLPAGALGGGILAATTTWRRGVRGAVVALVFAFVLACAGAVSDAVAISERVTSHLAAQIDRPGTWAAVGIAALAAMLPRTGHPGRGQGTPGA
jgi:hypothetical protein